MFPSQVGVTDRLICPLVIICMLSTWNARVSKRGSKAQYREPKDAGKRVHSGVTVPKSKVHAVAKCEHFAKKNFNLREK